MNISFHQLVDGAILRIQANELEFDKPGTRDQEEGGIMTIAWNTGQDQMVNIDDSMLKCPSQSIFALVSNQRFQFKQPLDIIAWQFNREFYCIMEHDVEVSCAGFLFYHGIDTMSVTLDNIEARRFEALFNVFVDEMKTKDELQAEMLRMLLKRLILKTTRLAKLQHLRQYDLKAGRFLAIRKFNLLVELYFRTQHQVRFYAQMLNKSPKTLTHIFARYNHKTPQEVIHERIILEAKRLLIYSDKSVKEISFALGFDDPNHFSHFFTQRTGKSPSASRTAAER